MAIAILDFNDESIVILVSSCNTYLSIIFSPNLHDKQFFFQKKRENKLLRRIKGDLDCKLCENLRKREVSLRILSSRGIWLLANLTKATLDCPCSNKMARLNFTKMSPITITKYQRNAPRQVPTYFCPVRIRALEAWLCVVGFRRPLHVRQETNVICRHYLIKNGNNKCHELWKCPFKESSDVEIWSYWTAKIGERDRLTGIFVVSGDKGLCAFLQ